MSPPPHHPVEALMATIRMSMPLSHPLWRRLVNNLLLMAFVLWLTVPKVFWVALWDSLVETTQEEVSP